MIEEGTGDAAPSLDLTIPKGLVPAGGVWTLVAHNKNVLNGWDSLCHNTPEGARRCYGNAIRPAHRFKIINAGFSGCEGDCGAGDMRRAAIPEAHRTAGRRDGQRAGSGVGRGAVLSVKLPVLFHPSWRPLGSSSSTIASGPLW